MKCKVLIVFCLLPVFAWANGNTDESPSPVAVVEKLQIRLIKCMEHGEDWDYARRFAELQPVVEKTYHFEVIAQVTLGRYWTGLAEKEQKGFAKRLKNLATANLAAEFDSHAGESFRTVGERELQRNQVHVRTILERPRRSDITFDYILARREEKWRVINVIVDGVSDLSIKRAEYQNVLRRGSFDALIEEIDKQIREFGGIPEIVEEKPDEET